MVNLNTNPFITTKISGCQRKAEVLATTGQLAFHKGKSTTRKSLTLLIVKRVRIIVGLLLQPRNLTPFLPPSTFHHPSTLCHPLPPSATRARRNAHARTLRRTYAPAPTRAQSPADTSFACRRLHGAQIRTLRRFSYFLLSISSPAAPHRWIGQLGRVYAVPLCCRRHRFWIGIVPAGTNQRSIPKEVDPDLFRLPVARYVKLGRRGAAVQQLAHDQEVDAVC